MSTERLRRSLVLTKNGVVVKSSVPEIKDGIPVTLARAICPNLIEEPYDSNADEEFLKKITLWATKKLSPMCGYHKEGGITTNLTGTERIYPDKSLLTKKLLGIFKKRGLSTQYAFASNPSLSFAKAKYLVDDLKLLPIEAVSSELKEFGLATVGELLRLPRKKLAVRFGEKVLISLLRLEGILPEPLKTLPAPILYEAKKRLEDPIQNKELLKKLVLKLFYECFKKLGPRKASFFKVILNQEIKEIPIFYFEQSWILSLAENLIENWVVKSPVSWILVRAYGIHFNNSLSEKDKVLSEINAYTFNFIESYIPERSFSFKKKSPDETNNSIKLPKLDRPSYFIHPPKKISAVSLLPDNPPTLIILDNKRVKLEKGFGPEVILGEWWKQDRQKREYFKVQNEEGLWLWIYRQENEWFLHGVWA